MLAAAGPHLEPASPIDEEVRRRLKQKGTGMLEGLGCGMLHETQVGLLDKVRCLLSAKPRRRAKAYSAPP